MKTSVRIAGLHPGVVTQGLRKGARSSHRVGADSVGTWFTPQRVPTDPSRMAQR
jgi:hypothetical protein